MCQESSAVASASLCSDWNVGGGAATPVKLLKIGVGAVNRTAYSRGMVAAITASRAELVAARLSRRNEETARSGLTNRVKMFATDEELIHFAEANDVSAVIWEFSREFPARLNPVPPEIIGLSKRVPLLLHVDLTASRARDLVGVVAKGAHVIIAVEDLGDLPHQLEALNRTLIECTAEQAIIRRFGPASPDFTVLIFVAAAIACRRRTTVAELSRLCKLSPDAVSYRLRATRGPHARDLVAGMMALHALWRCGVLDWPVKRAAAEAACSAKALRALVLRRTGVRIGHAVESHAFAVHLEEFARQWIPSN
jgi:hypothetical protein